MPEDAPTLEGLADEKPASPAADTPPKRKPGRPKGSTNKAGPRPGQFGSKSRKASLTPQLSMFFGSIGATVYAFDQTCGQSIMQGTPALAEALDELARENENVRRVLEGLMTAGTYSKLVVAVAGIALPIAAHHGLLPEGLAAGIPGVPTPEPSTNGHAAGDAAAA